MNLKTSWSCKRKNIAREWTILRSSIIINDVNDVKPPRKWISDLTRDMHSFHRIILCATWNERLMSVWQLPLARCTEMHEERGTKRIAPPACWRNKIYVLIVLSGRKPTAFHVWTRHEQCLSSWPATFVTDDDRFAFENCAETETFVIIRENRGKSRFRNFLLSLHFFSSFFRGREKIWTNSWTYI